VLLFPVFMAFARVYVGAHLPLDVVSGAAIGAAMPSVLHLLFGVPLTPSADPPVVAPTAPEPVHAAR
jgi:membrane-associated phospholipid phosphatase